MLPVNQLPHKQGPGRETIRLLEGVRFLTSKDRRAARAEIVVHIQAVLRDLLGLTDAEIVQLREQQII